MLVDKYIIEWDGKAVGIDANSGGYPFKTNDPNSVTYWNSKEEAQKYMDHWLERIWFVRRIQFRINNV